MPDVNVKIDDIAVSVPAGSTVLDAAKLAGIDIPVLCHYPGIEPIGACRMCLVEVEKQRVLQPACTFPVSEGMVVHTSGDKVDDSRKFVLQMLFSERNHFCMYCQMSGSCELQDLAYDYGIDHWEYDRAFPRFPVDASREFFAMDHNRCILCRRCIRVCDELVGNRTLGLKNRGVETMIIADMDVPFGESSCVSCGTCMQVCPTGALMDRASAYMGATDEVTRVKSRCTACPVGCGVELVIRDNRVIRVEGDWDAEPNHGLLCEVGRFHLLHEKRRRARKPMIKAADGWKDSGWDEGLAIVAAKLKGAGDKAQAIVSGYATTEAAEAIVKVLPGEATTFSCQEAGGCCESLAVLDEADLFIAVDTDLAAGANYQVAGFAIKRGVRNRGARLFLVGDAGDGMANWSMQHVDADDTADLVHLAEGAETPVIVYGPAGAETAKKLAEALPKAKSVSFGPEGNSLGLAKVGITKAFSENGATAYYVLAGEAPAVDEELAKALKDADFVAVQTSYQQPWLGLADVLLPSPTMFEKSGTIVNVEGRDLQVVAGVTTKLPSEVEIVERLSGLL